MLTPLIHRSYLLLSAVGVLVIALSYGIAPAAILPSILKVTIIDKDLIHIFRAVMGLYLAFTILWVVGAFSPRLTWTAILSEVVFMAGLAVGRVLSLLIDGLPSILLTVYLILEIILATVGIILLRNTSTKTT